MQFLLDSFLLIFIGIISILTGIFNVTKLSWGSTFYNGLEKLLGSDYTRFKTIFIGVVCIIIGLLLLVEIKP